MSAAEFSLLAVMFGFIALVWWVYSPRRRNRLESYGAIPLDEQTPQDDQREPGSGREGGRS